MNDRILKVVPTLIVGLGGTGALGVQYAKRKIQKRLAEHVYKEESLKKIPFVEYLVLDTTTQEEFIEELTGDQIINMGHKNLTRVISAMGHDPAYDAISWFPKHIDPGQIDSGARGVRSIGRLCFFLCKPIVERSLRDKIRSITDYSEVDRALKENFSHISLEPESSIDVHLVTSLCGGTGSACLLDVAYLIKNIIEDITKQGTNSVAHLVTTEPFGSETGIGRTTREYLNYNFAISLGEIEHFNRTGAWDITYLDKSRVASKEKPFSIANLLGNKEGESLSKKHICEAIGETIALNSVYPEGRYLKGLIDNMKAHVINSKDVLGNLRTYSSYNTRILTAELDAQTIEASNVFAGQSILDLLVQDGSKVEDVDSLVDHLANRIGASNLPIPGFNFGGFRDFIYRELGISGTPFDAIQRDLKNWAVARRFKAGKTTENWMMQYELVKKSREDRWPNIEDTITDNFIRLKRLVDDEIRRLVMDEARSLRTVEQLLMRIESEITTASGERNSHVESLGDPRTNYDQQMRGAISSGDSQRFGEIAVMRLHMDVTRPIFEQLDKCYLELKKFITDQKRVCAQAVEFIKQTREFLQEERVREFSYTVHSIWTKEIVADRIKAAKKLLAKIFLTKVEDEYLKIQKGSEQVRKGFSFVSYLTEDMRERKILVARLLRNTSKEIIENEIRSSTINFNRDEHGLENPALRTDKIYEFVESASPVWQIDRGGEDIASVSITNCPRNSVLGEIINDLGKNINFSENGSSIRDLLVYRSEHGVSARRLLNIDMAIAAVRRRLTAENKHDMNDLCLDPNWRIESPVPLERIDPLSLFSVGLMIGVIKQRWDSFYFQKANGKEVVLALSTDPNRSPLRHEAYAGFLRLESRGDEDWESLRSGIISARKRYDQDVIMLRKELDQHIVELKKLEVGTKVESEKTHFEDEILALKEHVIEPLDNYIKTKELVVRR